MTDKESIYLKVGQILNISQAIEYNLHYIIVYDNIYKTCYSKEEVINKLNNKNKYYIELSKQPLGYSIDQARKTNIFTEEFIEKLSKIAHTRNYYAHRFFKESFESNDIDTNKEKYINSLDRDIKRLNDMNLELGNDLNTLISMIKQKIK
jgi:hypothetical protein